MSRLINTGLILAILLGGQFKAAAQHLRGAVQNNNGEPSKGATARWQNSSQAVITNATGEFVIPLPIKLPDTLEVSFAGYKITKLEIKDTSFANIILEASQMLSNVTVTGTDRGHFISSNPIKTEVITSLELKKAACCDLAGCFETQASVQPQTTNILTNSKELRILGLSGIYNQVLVDGFPMVQALTYTYGISSVPGPLVESIFISKGANSVLQGFESISGQINVLTKEPDKADKFLVNAYISSFAEKHLNVLAKATAGRWKGLTTFHMVQPARRVDGDGDQFLDLPLLTRYKLISRWKKGDEQKWGWSTQFNGQYLLEKRVGGQTSFNHKRDKGSSDIYGQLVDIRQPELWFKTAYRMNDEHRFALYASGFLQDQQSYFGITSYNAKQTNGYANLQYEYYSKVNQLKLGLSYRHMALDERLSFMNNSLGRTFAGNYNKVENIPGLFAENVMHLFKDKLTWIAGVRVDHHNQFGYIFSPRTLLKYEVNNQLTVRASVGNGWRTANIFSENIGLLASSRDIIFAEVLMPEKATNFGFNITQKYKGENLEGYISLDFYHTRFSNQIFPDYDSEANKAVVKNFTGRSVSDGFQAEASGTFYNRFAMKMAYVYLDVFQVQEGSKDVLPFNPRHRFNASFSFMPLNKKWHLDANLHWYGKQRLPSTQSNPLIYQMDEQSREYSVWNAQYSRSWKKFELYAGVENIFNFRQRKPLISWQDPFGPYFDTQFAWGPTRGRELYIGARFFIK